MMDATIGALGFYLLGYGFAYGDRYECAPPTRGACGSTTRVPVLLYMRRGQRARLTRTTHTAPTA